MLDGFFTEIYKKCVSMEGALHITEVRGTNNKESYLPYFLNKVLDRKGDFILIGAEAPCGSYVLKLYIENGVISPEE